MGYVAGETILDDEYNTFVNSSSSPFGFNHFAGVGSTVYGLGQTHIAITTAGSTVLASQWNTLLAALDTVANHTNDTMTARTAVTAGDTVATKAALEADLATLAASVAAGSTSATALTTGSALQTMTTASEGWNGTATHQQTITWANNARMRHFFNAGGKVRIVTSALADTTNPKDQAFIDLGTALGNFDIGAHASTRSGSGETQSTDGRANGFHDLSTNYTSLYKLTSDNSNYTSNHIELFAKIDAAIGSAVTLTIKMVATDAADDTQYTQGNNDGPSGGDGDIKNTPKMRTVMSAITPNTDQGLAVSPTHASVSNEGGANGTTT